LGTLSGPKIKKTVVVVAKYIGGAMQKFLGGTNSSTSPSLLFTFPSTPFSPPLPLEVGPARRFGGTL